MPDLNPVKTGLEMKLATKPSRSTEANISITPVIAVKVAVAVSSRAGSPSGTTSASCVPVRMASVVVELTLRTRDVPIKA